MFCLEFFNTPDSKDDENSTELDKWMAQHPCLEVICKQVVRVLVSEKAVLCSGEPNFASSVAFHLINPQMETNSPTISCVLLQELILDNVRSLVIPKSNTFVTKGVSNVSRENCHSTIESLLSEVELLRWN